MPISVVICDDHTLVRSALRDVVEAEPDIRVLGEAASAAEALRLVRQERPDVLLLDVTMPDQSGIEALPELVGSAPETRILMLSMHDDPAYVRRALSSGAHGYLLKDAAHTELIHAVHDVSEGHEYLQPTLGARMGATAAGATTERAEDGLSDREHKVLRLLALGHINREIAALLGVSVRTVEGERTRILKRLGLKTRAEIVRYVLDTGALEA